MGPKEEELVQPLKSGYMREFTQPYPNRCKPIEKKEFTPDFMFNRVPKNDFDPLTGTDYKFLDDHIRKVPEVRKKVNFFRQMRWVEGEYLFISFSLNKWSMYVIVNWSFFFHSNQSFLLY